MHAIPDRDQQFSQVELVLAADPGNEAEVLQLAASACLAFVSKLRATFWKGQSRRNKTVAPGSSLAEFSADRSMNFVELTAVGLEARLFISPTSRNWAVPEPLSLPCSREAEGKWWLAEGLENMRRWNEIQWFPSSLAIRWRRPQSDVEAEAMFKSFLGALDVPAKSFPILGGGRLAPRRIAADEIWFSVLGKPRAGESFRVQLPAPREVLVGPMGIIEVIASKLSGRCSVWNSTCGGLAVLRARDESEVLEIFNGAGRRLFVEETTKSLPRPHDPTRGEFLTSDGETVLTRNRRRELFGELQRTPRVTWSLLISEAHCKAVRMDPGQMVEVQLGPAQREIRDRAVAQSLLGRSNSSSLRQRIWDAYRRAYMGESSGGAPLLGSLHRTEETLQIAEKLWSG